MIKFGLYLRLTKHFHLIVKFLLTTKHIYIFDFCKKYIHHINIDFLNMDSFNNNDFNKLNMCYIIYLPKKYVKTSE